MMLCNYAFVKIFNFSCFKSFPTVCGKSQLSDSPPLPGVNFRVDNIAKTTGAQMPADPLLNAALPGWLILVLELYICIVRHDTKNH